MERVQHLSDARKISEGGPYSSPDSFVPDDDGKRRPALAHFSDERWRIFSELDGRCPLRVRAGQDRKISGEAERDERVSPSGSLRQGSAIQHSGGRDRL